MSRQPVPAWVRPQAFGEDCIPAHPIQAAVRSPISSRKHSQNPTPEEDNGDNLVQIEKDEEIKQRLQAERARLRQIAGLDQLSHFHRPVERAFTAEERNQVTILFGGFTWKHEDLIRAVFQGCGYRCEKLPVPNVAAFQTGKEYGNNGQCNPTYFTVGNLVQYLQFLEKEGIPRQQILDNYVFFTAGSCGPCRFGMYEAEYRFALQNAGFDGFRVLLFQQNDGIKAASGEPGLKFTVDFGIGMLNAHNLGDVMNDLIYQIRPYEIEKGKTDVVFPEAMEMLTDVLRNRDDDGDLMDRLPPWAGRILAKNRPDKKLKHELKYRSKWAGVVAGEAMWTHFYHRIADRLGGITHHLVPQQELAQLANPFYHQLTRGGEGHLEVGKNVYYTVNHLCHMVLALKPFGCMPSSQSDGVQSAVINKFKDMVFLPIETSGEGEVNAHSRVQMALGEAKAKAKAEFEACLKTTGKRLDDIKGYVADHPELRRPFYHVPHRPGVAGPAAQFIMHVSDRMDGKARAAA